MAEPETEAPRRKLPLKRLAIVMAVLCVVVVVIALIFKNITSYKQEITMPHADLYFNETTYKDEYYCGMGPTEKPIYSKADMIHYFHADPLKNLSLPSGIRSNFCTQNDKTMFESHENFINNEDKYKEFYIFFMANPNDDRSKFICFDLMTKLSPAVADKGQKTSLFYNTKVVLTHVSKKNNHSNIFNGELFTAKITYKNIGYSIMADNGVSQQDFINMLTSIIRS